MTTKISTPNLEQSTAGSVVIIAWFVSCFIPNPAIPVGATSCINLSHILLPVVLFVARWDIVPWKNGLRSILVGSGALLAATICNIYWNLSFDVGLGLKGLLFLESFLVQILGGMFLCSLSYRQVCAGIMIAFGLNVAMAITQFVCYSRGFFPLPEIFNHYAFGDPSGIFEAFGRYSNRPSGLYPEPSAMAASIGPWACWLFASVLGGETHFRAKRDRTIALIAALTGLGVIFLSQSGFSPILLALLFGYCFLTLGRSRIMILVLAIACLGGLLVIRDDKGDTLAQRLIQRVEHEDSLAEGGSWHSRSDSLFVAFRTYTSGDVGTIFYGLGPNNGYLTMQQSNFDSVCSVVGILILDTGLFGLFAMGFIGWAAWAGCRMSLNPSPLVLLLIAWLTAFAVITSYWQIAAPWATLGFMLGGGCAFPQFKPTKTSSVPSGTLSLASHAKCVDSSAS